MATQTRMVPESLVTQPDAVPRRPAPVWFATMLAGGVLGAVADHARQQVGDLPAVEGFTNHGGQGVSGVVDGHAVVVGRAGWLREEWAMVVPAALQAEAEEAESEGRTPVWVGWDGRVRATVVVSDTVKDSSAEAVARLRGLGLRPVLLTGDNARACLLYTSDAADE